MEMKAEMKQYLRRHLQQDGVTKFIFSAGDEKNVEWESPGEFSFHGQMYDVVKKEQQGIKLLVYCVRDGRKRRWCTTLYNRKKMKHR